MILQPFTVASGGKNYTYVDRLAIDSEILKQEVLETTALALDFVQFDATCEELGMSAEGSIPSMKFGVFESGNLCGIWMMGCIQYVSGPWIDTVDWVKSSGVAARFTSRVMPGFLTLADDVEDAIATATAIHLLSRTPILTSHENIDVCFDSLHWAIYKDRNDPIDQRANRLHDAAVAHAGLDVVETIDPVAADRTLVKLERS